MPNRRPMYKKEKFYISYFPFKFGTNTNIVVERVPLFAWTSSSLALTVLMVSHSWFIENQSWFTNESRNAMVLPYDFWIYSEVIRRDRAPFSYLSEKY